MFGVVMSGYRYENWSVTIPFLTRDVDYRPQNYVLKFFVSSALLVIIGGVYYSRPASPVIRKLIVLKVPTPAMNFADLCSVANISVFIFDSFCHGYYIHGVRLAHRSSTPSAPAKAPSRTSRKRCSESPRETRADEACCSTTPKACRPSRSSSR